MRKLVYAFYNDGFSFSGFLRKYPEERVHIINLLIGDVFKEGVDSIYGPMSEFAEIPPPLYEQVDGTIVPRSRPPTIRPSALCEVPVLRRSLTDERGFFRLNPRSSAQICG